MKNIPYFLSYLPIKVQHIQTETFFFIIPEEFWWLGAINSLNVYVYWVGAHPTVCRLYALARWQSVKSGLSSTDYMAQSHRLTRGVQVSECILSSWRPDLLDTLTAAATQQQRRSADTEHTESDHCMLRLMFSSGILRKHYSVAFRYWITRETCSNEAVFFCVCVLMNQHLRTLVHWHTTFNWPLPLVNNPLV